MNKKKLYVGSLALALALGAVAPGLSSGVMPVAYAGETNTAINPNAGNPTPDENQNKELPPREQLANLTKEEEVKKVKDSNGYNNASDLEKQAYNDAIAKVKEVNADTTDEQIRAIVNDIKTAIERFGSNSIDTIEIRNALRDTIAIANKVYSSDKLKSEESEGIKNKIDEAQAEIKNINITKDELTTRNKDLNQATAELINKYQIDVENLKIDDNDLSNVKLDNNTELAEAYKRLFDLQKYAVTLYDNNLKNSDKLTNEEKTQFKKATDEAKGLLNKKLNVSLDQYNNSYDKLRLLVESAEAKIGAETTRFSTLLAELNDLVTTDRNKLVQEDRYKNANPAAKAHYDNAVNTAIALTAEGAKPTDQQVRNAINSIKYAKFNLAPVKTQIITDSSELKSDSEEKDALDKAIKNADVVMALPKFVHASEVRKEAYKKAIEDAKNTLGAQGSKAKDYNSARMALISAEGNLDGKLPAKDDEKLSESLLSLNSLVAEATKVRESEAYKNASNDLKNGYDKAISAASQLSTNHASGSKKATNEEILGAMRDIFSAQEAIGYKQTFNYKTNIKDLLEEAPEFMKTPPYIEKSQGTSKLNRKLIDLYKEKIKEIELKDKFSNYSKIDQQEDVNKIIEIQKAINGEKSAAEVILNDYVFKDPEFKKKSSFTNAQSSKDNPALVQATKDYTALIEQANRLLNATEKDTESMTRVANQLDKVTSAIENPENSAIITEYKISRLEELIRQAENAKTQADYKTKINEADRTKLENALTNAKTVYDNTNRTPEQLDKALNDLDEALKPVRNAVNTNKSKSFTREDIQAMELQQLIDLAERVKKHKDYSGVGKTQKDSFINALGFAKANLNGTPENQKIATEGLRGALLQKEIFSIVQKLDKVNTNEPSVEASNLENLKKQVDLADKVKNHEDYKAVDDKIKTPFEAALTEAKAAIESKDEKRIESALAELNRQLAVPEIDAIVKKIKAMDATELRKNLETIVKDDEAFRGRVPYKKAKKANRDAYDKAIEKAKEVLKKEDATADELKTVHTELVAAMNNLDGNQYDAKLEELKKKAATITDANKKAEIEAKIKEIEANPDATMDDLVALEAAINEATKPVVTTTPVTTTGTTVTTTPVPATTTTPVTTTSQVPATVNPGSIVRTGIKSLMGVAVVLVVALAGYFLLAKNKDDKNNPNNTRRPNNPNNTNNRNNENRRRKQ